MTTRAAIYARFSSDNQREESIDAQIRACEDYARRNGLVIVKTYADRAKTATSDRRPEFQMMIADSAKSMFDILIVHKLDRFSRDKYDSVYYKRKLKQSGIRLVSVTENLDGSPESVMLESMLEGMAQYYSLNLAREVMKGMRENAYQCRHTGGAAPLGFDVDPATKKLVINEEEAETIRLIFKLYLEGYGYGTIIGRLNELGRKTKKGQPFGKNSIHGILSNAKYAGVYTFNLSPGKDAFGRRSIHGRKAEEDMIRIDGGVPAIVSKAVFQEAQAKKARNKHKPGAYKNAEVYLLSGKIMCGECLAAHGQEFAMVGNRRKESGRSKLLYVSYRCGNRDRHGPGSCTNSELRREYIENFVIHELERRIFNERNIPVLTDRLNEHLRKTSQSGQDDLKRANAELAKVERQIDNIVAAVTNGNAFPALLDKMGELEERKMILETRVAELRSMQRDVTVTQDDLRSLFAMFRKAVGDKNMPGIKRFIDSYVDRVIVYRTRVEVTFKVQAPGMDGSRPLEIRSDSDRLQLRKGS